MTDITVVLPGFPTQQYVRLLPSLEKHLITTADLITLDVAEIAKRAQLPLLDLERLCNAVLEAIHVSLGVSDIQDEGTTSLKKSEKDVVNRWNTISTLDDELDRALGGGIPTGYITEVTGER
jgi:DNA repair protein RAD57